jgi:molecular chaperone DnaK (HSP70)
MAWGNADMDEYFKLVPTSPTIGIDLGTENSYVGYFKNNNVKIIKTASGEDIIYTKILHENCLGKRNLPSYVSYNRNGGFITGEEAKMMLKTTPDFVFYDSKRMIGLNYDYNLKYKNSPFGTFRVEKKYNNRPVYFLDKDHQFLAEEVSSEIIKELVKMAQNKIGTEKIKVAVIAVPEYFLIGQKEATIHAAKLAGIDHVKLITEPIAAALAYSYAKKNFDEHNLFVFDLGAGKCEVSIVKVEKGEFKVIGYAADSELGGREYDKILMDYFYPNFKEVVSDSKQSKMKRMMKLRETCENLKIAFSNPETASQT